MAKKLYKALSSLADKASNDSTFRKDLLKRPKELLEKQLDLKLPEEVKVVIHENSLNTIHLTIPLDKEKLSESDLQNIAGGRTPFERETKTARFLTSDKVVSAGKKGARERGERFVGKWKKLLGIS